METLLKSITREPYGTTISDIIAQAGEGEEVSVVFKAVHSIPKHEESKPLHITGDHMRKGHEYIVKVKAWMTKPTSNSGFDFMYHWNKNVPMPLRVMRGRVLSETRGMVYMELRACPLKTDYCMKCGRPLTHPVSRLYGLGPECGGHYHINPFNTEEELQEAIHEVREKLNNVTWTGWIAKSGVEYATEVLPNGDVARR
jgi:hypothetical protein